MRAATRILSLGLAVYTAAWFMKVVDGGKTLADGMLPGWEALRVALSPIWPYDDIQSDGWLGDVLSVASGLTNLLVLAFPLWLHLARHHRVAWAVGPFILAAAVDAQWMYPDAEGLRWGYYMWLGSFIILAIGLARAARTLPPAARQ